MAAKGCRKNISGGQALSGSKQQTWAETDTLHEPMDDHNTAECERADVRFRSEAEDMCDSACPGEVGSGSPIKDMRQHKNLQRFPREDAMVSDPL